MLHIKLKLPSGAECQIEFKVPEHCDELAQEIEESKYILELPNGWGDDEEAKSYSVEVWQQAIYFLLNIAYATIQAKKSMPTPKIYHGPNGSIDFLWSNPFLLLNFPAEQDKPVTFHCSQGKSSITGTILKEQPFAFEQLFTIF